MKRRISLHCFVLRSLVLAFLAGTMLLPPASAAFKYLQEGMPAPELKGVDLLSGEKISLEQGGDKDVTVVVFWATWSERSLELLRDLKKMAEDFPSHGFRVIVVNVEQERISPEMREMIIGAARDLDLPFPVILDEGLSLFYLFGVIAVPSTALLDGSLILRFGPSGYSYTIHDQLEDSTKVLLGLAELSTSTGLIAGYKPKNEASRYYQLAVMLAGKQMYERALANLDQAVLADSLFSAPHNLRGQILLNLGDPTASDAFAHAVKLADSSVAAWAGWGRALLAQGDPEAAVEKLESALALDETYVPALVDLALCVLEEGDPEAALSFLLTAQALNPHDPSLLFHLGQLSLANGNKAAALESFRAALKTLYPAP